MSGGTYRVLRGFSRVGVEVKAGELVRLERAPREPGFFEPVESDVQHAQALRLQQEAAGTGEPMTPAESNTVTGNGSGEPLPPIAGDGAQQLQAAPAPKGKAKAK